MRLHLDSHRRAMTLIELLVVIGIIGVLFALSLPAVQRVREVAGQTGCRNNLRQLGIALHGYQGVNGYFPPGYLFDETVPPEPWQYIYVFPGWSWTAHILPQIEQSNLAQKIQWNRSVEDEVHAAIRIQIINTLLCPSDRNTGQFTVLNQINKPIADAATNSYTACYGFGGRIGEYPAAGNGIFYRNSKTRTADIRDGISNTIAIGERGSFFAQSPWAGTMTDGTVRTHPNAPSLIAAIEEAPTMVMGRASLYALNPQFADLYDFLSPHTGMGLFALADGSVRPIRVGARQELWEALSTRAGGEVVPADE